MLLSLLAIGPGGNVEYFEKVLPMHARGEVFVKLQYSLTHVLAVLGVPAATAVSLGSLSYAVLAILAVVIAVREPATPLGRARAILLPVAIVALGGTYIHHQQICLAIPAAFALVPSMRTGSQRLALTAAFYRSSLFAGHGTCGDQHRHLCLGLWRNRCLAVADEALVGFRRICCHRLRAAPRYRYVAARDVYENCVYCEAARRTAE